MGMITRENVIRQGEFMKASLCLHVPAYEELWYRQKIMQDPDTMSYNKGYDLNFHGYDEATGCIAFPKEKWADWSTARRVSTTRGVMSCRLPMGVAHKYKVPGIRLASCNS